MEKEEQLLRKRILELSRISFERDIPTHTDFLNLYEQTVFHSLAGSFPDLRYQLAGGHEMAERKMVCFLPSYEEEAEASFVACVGIMPAAPKFAKELAHRDCLGAVMNLGIDRGKVGDILLDGQGAYVMCMNELAPYVADNLSTVGHTQVTCRICPLANLDYQPAFERVTGSVASIRLDVLVSLAYHLPRSKSSAYIQGEKVFVNGRLASSGGYVLKEGDVVSARGFGKFIYRKVESETKKGRFMVSLDKYC